MLSITAGFLFILVAFVLIGCFFCWLGLTKKDEFTGVMGICIFFLLGNLLGIYQGGGSPFPVNNGEKYSQAKFVPGHRYETLVKVPFTQEKSGVFVIKDGESEQVLLIRVLQETLPPHFTVGGKQNIIALPAPASAASAPVVSK